MYGSTVWFWETLCIGLGFALTGEKVACMFCNSIPQPSRKPESRGQRVSSKQLLGEEYSGGC